ncbi:MAG: 1-acyl-sn-glycerol-3-phosphate acyltransferase, partial [Bacilli bacterium]|nr:1-acyl-sn-glycerol-3-phosphate acyltransferase [Bacilli bacterium]
MRYFKLVNKVGFYILKNYYKWMKPYGKHPERVPFETRYNRFRKFLKVFNERVGVSLYVKGKENIPNDVCFFAPNHQGFLDPLMLVDIVDKPTSFVGKVEVQKYPFVNYAFKGLDGLFLERDNLRTSIKIIRQVEQSLIADEKSWGIFPEGTRTRNKDFELNDFHAGTFKIALDSKKPIVPVAIFGTSRVL